jgi:hypothetical protein
MIQRLKRLVYITEPKFDLPDYRKPIVWFDKMLITVGILAGIAGRIVAALWVLGFASRDPDLSRSHQWLVAGVMLWAAGEYFTRTGNRGLIYYHVDMLTEYLERRVRDVSRTA